MPINKTLRSPAAQNLLAATVAGAAVLLRPARIPTWARRGFSLANTAGTAGSMLMGTKTDDNGGALGLKPVSSPRNQAATTGSAIAAATGGLGLVTSGIGLKLDAKVENYLVGKGVKRPRIWMAVGVIGLVFVVKTIQDAAAKKAESAATKLAENREVPPAGAAVRPAPAKPPVVPQPPVAGTSTAHEDDTPIWKDVTRETTSSDSELSTESAAETPDEPTTAPATEPTTEPTNE